MWYFRDEWTYWTGTTSPTGTTGKNEQLFGSALRTKKDPRIRAIRGSDPEIVLNLFLVQQGCSQPEDQNPDPHHSCVNPEGHLIDRLHSCEEYEHQHTDTRKPKS